MKRLSIKRLATVLGAVPLLLAALSCASTGKKNADPIANLKAGIQKEVGDPSRAAAMTASVDEMDRLVGALAELATRQRAEVEPMLRDYTASRADVDAKLASFDAERKTIAGKILDAHLAFKAQATPAEWTKLRQVEERALAYAASRSLGQKPLLGKEE